MAPVSVLSTSPTSPAPQKNFPSADTGANALLGEVDVIRGLLDRGAPIQDAVTVLARAVADLPKRERESLVVDQLRAFVLELAVMRPDAPVREDALVGARALANHGWPGVLAAMLQVPAWQWPDAPLLDAVPDWLWSDYVQWTFTPPRAFTAPGQTEAYAVHVVRHLEQLSRWATRNPGSAAVQAATTRYLAAMPAAYTPLLASAGSLHRHACLHAQVLARGSRRSNAKSDTIVPRDGRRLRVGVLARETEITGATLFEPLDPERFETTIFVLPQPESFSPDPLPAFAQLLPTTLAEQREQLSAALLDVVVFAGDLCGATDVLAQLATTRFAPLQIATTASPDTTGLPEVDLYVAGALTGLDLAQHVTEFSERLAFVPGPARVARIPQPAETFVEETLTRATYQLPENSFVLLVPAPLAQITPKVQLHWARVLKRVPTARLLLQPLPAAGVPAESTAAFCARFDRLLDAEGCAADQLVVLDRPLSSYDELRPLLALADLCLDATGAMEPGVLLLALAAGVPVITTEGPALRSRFTASTLRTVGLANCVAATPAAFEEIIAAFAQKSPDDRATSRAQLRETLERTPACVDTLGFADAFGGLIDAAFDRLATIGRQRFREERSALLPTLDPAAFGERLAEVFALIDAARTDEALVQLRPLLAQAPANARCRHAYGRILLAQGAGERATIYLLAAVEDAETDQALWHHLALALHAGGRTAEAVQALEACVRLDPTQLEPWLLLADWAQTAGNESLCAEVAGVVQELAPADPRVLDLAARVAV